MAVGVDDGDVIVRLKAAVAYYKDVTVASGIATTTTAGQVGWWGDGTAANTGLLVITDAVNANASLAGAGALINGATLVDTDSIGLYASLSSEVPTTASTYSYDVGDVIVVTDNDVPANNGLYVVETALPIGGDLTAADALGTGITFVVTNDRIATLFTAPVKSNIYFVHDTEPVITKSAAALATTTVTENAQDVAIFDITPKGTRNLFIESITVKCTGGGSGNAGFNDNLMEVYVKGQLKASNADGVNDCVAGKVLDFAEPVEIPAGGSEAFTIKYNTAATGGEWATGETLVFKIDGTAGRAAGTDNGLNWYYTVATTVSGAVVPTAASPNSYSDSYPVNGPTLTR